jgi:hypothetical protein
MSWAEQIREFRCLKVSYISLVDSTELHDILRVSPKWRGGGKRQDYVVIDGGEKPLFAQVLGMFQIWFRGKDPHPIALVRYLKYKRRHPLSDYIELEDKKDLAFVHLNSVVRACHILPPMRDDGRFTVADIVDHDMYFRLFSLR